MHAQKKKGVAKMYGSVEDASRSQGVSAIVHSQIDGSSRRKRRNQVNNASIQYTGTTPTPPVNDGGRSAANSQRDDSAGSAGTARGAAVNGNNIALRKELNLISGTSVVIGLMIGSGIFITPSSILGYTQSFGLTLILWVVGGLIALIGGLCFCELGVLVKKSGSTYTFILEGYSFRRSQKPWLSVIGSLLAFLNIWSSTVVSQPAALAVGLLTFGRYVCRPFFIGCSEVPIIPVKMLALSALALLVLVNAYSVKLAARLMTGLSSLKIIAMAVVVALGVWHFIDKGSFSEDARQPFANSTTSPSSIALALYGVMWAYDGWDAIFQVLEETKNTEKTLVRVAFLGVPIVILCYCLVNLSFFAVLSYEEIQSAEAVGLIFGQAVVGKAGLVIISLLVALATFGSAHSSLFTAARQVFVSSRDGNLPELLSGVHVTFRTPMPGVLLHGTLASVMIAVGSIDQLIDAFSASAWIFYGLAIGALLIMRLTHDDVHRSFKVWLLLPCFMLLVAIFLVVVPLWQNPVPQLLAFGGILLGVPVFIVFVMEKPIRVKPKLFDKISRCLTRSINMILNTQTSKLNSEL